MAAIQLKLDLAKPRGRIEYIDARQGDSEIAVEVTVTDNAAPFDFGEHYYLEMVVVRPNGDWAVITEGCEQQDSTQYGNVWDVTIPAAVTSEYGTCELCYCVVKDDSDANYRRSTQRFLLNFDQSATGEASVREYSDQVDNLIAQCDILMTNWGNQITQQAETFSAAQTQRAADWQAQMDDQQDGYEAAEKSRDQAYAAAEQARGTAFSEAQTSRATTFSDAQEAQAAAFTAAEAKRDQDVADAVDAANAATARANAAAASVEQALEGDLSALFDDYLDTKKDVAGGFVSYETFSAAIFNAGTPDNVTLSKNASNQLQIHPDYQALIESIRSAVFDDITGNPWALTFSTSEYATLVSGIYDSVSGSYCG